jgi:LmbE family N-acetylglucosaminyl deacetylase
MKKLLFAIFAHPDDESFGPSGTLLLETRAGTELHLLLLTSGDSGMNPDNHLDLSSIRLQEWQAAGKLMGAHSMQYLGYKDGQLNNHSMIEISGQIQEIVASAVSNLPADTQIEFITNDTNGITGHIDHIVASRAACHAYFSLKKNDQRFKRMRLCCLSREDLPSDNIEWLYMEAGRTADEIDEIIDARHLHDEITTIIRAHHTQRGDGEQHIARRGDQLGLDRFIVKR